MWPRQSYGSGCVRTSDGPKLGVFYGPFFGSYLFTLWLSCHTSGKEIGCLKKERWGLGCDSGSEHWLSMYKAPQRREGREEALSTRLGSVQLESQHSRG